MELYMPVRLYTGKGCISAHKDVFSKYGKMCTIVTGRSSAKKSGVLDEVLNSLESVGVKAELFDGAKPNPSVDSCMEAGKIAAANGSDFIIGIGGGSSLDSAKAAAVFAVNQDLDEASFYTKDWKKHPLPIILIGTTSGTGSEVTKVSVLTDCTHKKHSINDDRMYAAVSFGDYSYTMNLPLNITLSTGVDVLMHCAESYFSPRSGEISRAYSLKGIRLIAGPLTDASEGKELTEKQRSDLYDASILGGLAIAVASTSFPHNAGYYLTEKYHLSHGFACAEFLPELLDRAEETAPELSEQFYRELGLGRDFLPQLVENCLPKEPIVMTQNEIDSIYMRWENNRSVQNVIGGMPELAIKKILEKRFVK